MFGENNIKLTEAAHDQAQFCKLNYQQVLPIPCMLTHCRET